MSYILAIQTEIRQDDYFVTTNIKINIKAATNSTPKQDENKNNLENIILIPTTNRAIKDLQRRSSNTYGFDN